MEATGKQVNSRASGTQRGFCTTHTGKGTATIDVYVGKAVDILGLCIVNEHVGLCLHGVVQLMMTGETLAAAKDEAHLIVGVVGRYEVNERVIAQIGEGE